MPLWKSTDFVTNADFSVLRIFPPTCTRRRANRSPGRFKTLDMSDWAKSLMWVSHAGIYCAYSSHHITSKFLLICNFFRDKRTPLQPPSFFPSNGVSMSTLFLFCWRGRLVAFCAEKWKVSHGFYAWEALRAIGLVTSLGGGRARFEIE